MMLYSMQCSTAASCTTSQLSSDWRCQLRDICRTSGLEWSWVTPRTHVSFSVAAPIHRLVPLCVVPFTSYGPICPLTPSAKALVIRERWRNSKAATSDSAPTGHINRWCWFQTVRRTAPQGWSQPLQRPRSRGGEKAEAT